MNLEKLDKILIGEPKYRKDQILEAIFKNFIADWNQADNLPKSLRENLKKNYALDIQAEIFVSDNKKTIKAIITLTDNAQIETVLMRHNEERNTVCVSCQVGCGIGCKFCATGKMGLKRNLTYLEILEQVLFFTRLLNGENGHIDNVVFMGMGEPFLNYENVIAAIKILNNPKFFNIGARHISVSTSGIIPGIKKLAKEPLQINLALSLHAADDKTRSSIMPINKIYPLDKVMEAIDDYIKKTARRVMIEYLLLKDVNDSEKDAKNLGLMLHRRLCFVNLISYNPTGNFQASPTETIKKFKSILEKNGIQTTQRYRFGRGIRAACGQLIIH